MGDLILDALTMIPLGVVLALIAGSIYQHDRRLRAFFVVWALTLMAVICVLVVVGRVALVFLIPNPGA